MAAAVASPFRGSSGAQGSSAAAEEKARQWLAQVVEPVIEPEIPILDGSLPLQPARGWALPGTARRAGAEGAPHLAVAPVTPISGLPFV